MSAWSSPRTLAINALVKERPLPCGCCRTSMSRYHATLAVDELFRQLAEPDRDLLDAGMAELSRAPAGGVDRRVARRIVEDIWHAMVDRARQ